MTLSQQSDTIVALSSGHLPSGIAVIRATGPKARDLCALFSVKLPKPRYAQFCSLSSPVDDHIFDEGMVLYFPAPNSFSGEDLIEFQLHGSRAVVQHFIECAVNVENVRLAQPGEFTRRAFENGKIDLTRVEGIADLIEAQTSSQRDLAVSRMRGELKQKIDIWRQKIISLRAEIEARLDFSDEDDVPFELPKDFIEQLVDLKSDVLSVISGFEQGRLVREGLRIALLGEPNAGKSSLLNALAQSDIAIVTDIPGTTRDSIETEIVIDGHLFRFIDTAGIRDTEDRVEKIGIGRSKEIARGADLKFWLTEDGTVSADMEIDWVIETKSDSRETISENLSHKQIMTSTNSNDGLDQIKAELVKHISQNDSRETLLISHNRDKEALSCAAIFLQSAENLLDLPELLAEDLRAASHEMQRLLGEIDVEDVLDELFAGFCIGK